MTVYAQNRACLFGDIVNDEMTLNDADRMAEQCWVDIPKHFFLKNFVLPFILSLRKKENYSG